MPRPRRWPLRPPSSRDTEGIALDPTRGRHGDARAARGRPPALHGGVYAPASRPGAGTRDATAAEVSRDPGRPPQARVASAVRDEFRDAAGGPSGRRRTRRRPDRARPLEPRQCLTHKGPDAGGRSRVPAAATLRKKRQRAPVAAPWPSRARAACAARRPAQRASPGPTSPRVWAIGRRPCSPGRSGVTTAARRPRSTSPRGGRRVPTPPRRARYPPTSWRPRRPPRAGGRAGVRRGPPGGRTRERGSRRARRCVLLAVRHAGEPRGGSARRARRRSVRRSRRPRPAWSRVW